MRRPGEAFGESGALVPLGGVHLLLRETSRAPKVSVTEVSVFEVRSLKVGTLQVGSTKVRPLQLRVSELGPR